MYNTLTCFETYGADLQISLLEPVSCLGYQTPMDVILEEDIVSARKHTFFHDAFFENEKLQSAAQKIEDFDEVYFC